MSSHKKREENPRREKDERTKSARTPRERDKERKKEKEKEKAPRRHHRKHHNTLADKSGTMHRKADERFEFVTKRRYDKHGREISRDFDWTQSYSEDFDADFDFDMPNWKEMMEKNKGRKHK